MTWNPPGVTTWLPGSRESDRSAQSVIDRGFVQAQDKPITEGIADFHILCRGVV